MKPGGIEDRISFPTGSPDDAMERVIAYFRDRPVEAIGIGSFGPIDVDPSSKSYGVVTTTPKPGWAGFDFLLIILRRR